MTPDEAHAAAPTNAALMVLLDAVRAELAEVNAGQRQLTRVLEQLTKQAE